MKKYIGYIFFLWGIIVMMILIVQILAFWYNHDTMTGMQVMKAMKGEYFGILLNWILAMIGSSLIKEK